VQFDLNAGAVTVALEDYVREHLEELASESLGPRRFGSAGAEAPAYCLSYRDHTPL